MRFAHVMLRVKDLDKSIDFYTNILGMSVQKKADNPEYKYTLVFLGYGDISSHTVLELTYNWDDYKYDHGNAFGHLCMQVDDVYKACEDVKAKGGSTVIAFIKDPDGYQIELIEKA